MNPNFENKFTNPSLSTTDMKILKCLGTNNPNTIKTDFKYTQDTKNLNYIQDIDIKTDKFLTKYFQEMEKLKKFERIVTQIDSPFDKYLQKLEKLSNPNHIGAQIGLLDTTVPQCIEIFNKIGAQISNLEKNLQRNDLFVSALSTVNFRAIGATLQSLPDDPNWYQTKVVLLDDSLSNNDSCLKQQSDLPVPLTDSMESPQSTKHLLTVFEILRDIMILLNGINSACNLADRFANGDIPDFIAAFEQACMMITILYQTLLSAM